MPTVSRRANTTSSVKPPSAQSLKQAAFYRLRGTCWCRFHLGGFVISVAVGLAARRNRAWARNSSTRNGTSHRLGLVGHQGPACYDSRHRSCRRIPDLPARCCRSSICRTVGRLSCRRYRDELRPKAFAALSASVSLGLVQGRRARRHEDHPARPTCLWAVWHRVTA